MSEENTKSPVTSSQNIEKIKQTTPEPKQSKETKETKEAKDPQTITLPISQLLKWEKKSKQLTNQVKALTTENQSFKQQIVQLKKNKDQKRKNDNVVQGMQQTIKQLQRILDENMAGLNKYKKQNSKLQDQLNITKQMLNSRESELLGLRQTASDYFLLKQEVNRLENQVTTLKIGQTQITKLRQELESSKDTIEIKQLKIVQLQQKISTANKQKQLLTSEKKQLQNQILVNKQKLTELQRQKSTFDDRAKQYEMQIDDLEKQNQLSMTKYVQQIKDLKDLLLREKSERQNYEANFKLQKQQKQVEEMKRRQDIDNLAEKDSEYLLTKIQELETQNAVTKYMMNETSSKISLIEQKLKGRTQALVILVKEYSSRWPNFDQSQGLEYVQKDLLKQIAGDGNRSELVDTVERCVIENSRLKNMIEMIGSEYNNELRRKENM